MVDGLGIGEPGLEGHLEAPKSAEGADPGNPCQGPSWEAERQKGEWKLTDSN